MGFKAATGNLAGIPIRIYIYRPGKLQSLTSAM